MCNLLTGPATAAMVIAVATASLLTSGVATAESLYVTDKTSIDVYSSIDDIKPNSIEPVKSLPTGSIVKVLARKDGYTRIRTNDDTEGWVQSKYLSNDKPTRIEYSQLAAKYQALQEKLQTYQTRTTEMQELSKEAQTADWLRNKLSDYRQTEQELQNELRVKDIAIAELKINVANLQDRLDETMKQLQYAGDSAAMAAQYSDGDVQESSLFKPQSATGFYTWLALSLAVTLIIGVLMGFVLIDYNGRRKQGDLKLNS